MIIKWKYRKLGQHYNGFKILKKIYVRKKSVYIKGTDSVFK